MHGVAPSLTRNVPEFPGFSVTLPKGCAPETLLERRALEDLCNLNIFLGSNPREVLEENGIISLVWKPAISSLQSTLRKNEPCSLQYLDIHNTRLGVCASTRLVQQYGHGEFPEQLATNDGIREVFWLRMMKQLANDCLKRGGGSLTGISVASELLNVTAEEGKALLRRARNQDLILMDEGTRPLTIIPTSRLITLLNVPELTALFKSYQDRIDRSSSARASRATPPIDTAQPSDASMEALVLPARDSQSKVRAPRKEPIPTAVQFADLFEAITAVFQENQKPLLAAMDVWHLVKARGGNPRSPGRVAQICDELVKSGLLRKSEEAKFQFRTN